VPHVVPDAQRAAGEEGGALTWKHLDLMGVHTEFSGIHWDVTGFNGVSRGI